MDFQALHVPDHWKVCKVRDFTVDIGVVTMPLNYRNTSAAALEWVPGVATGVYPNSIYTSSAGLALPAWLSSTE